MHNLKKTLGAVSGTAMMLNVVLGAGLLILPGLAAKSIGADSFWVWLAAIAAAFPLLWIFALLSARFPDAGGVAHIVAQSFGRIGSVAASFLFLGAVSLGLPSIALTGGYYYAALATTFDAPTWLADSSMAAAMLLCIACGLNLCAPDLAKRVGAAAAACMSVFIIALLAVALFTMRAEMPSDSMHSQLSAILSPTNLNFASDWRLIAAVFLMVFFGFTG